MWRIELEICDGTTQILIAKNKYEAKMKYDHFINKVEVVDVAVFDGDDFIDPVEL